MAKRGKSKGRSMPGRRKSGPVSHRYLPYGTSLRKDMAMWPLVPSPPHASGLFSWS